MIRSPKLPITDSIAPLLAKEEEETEGVIQYRIDFTPAPPPEIPLIAELNAWRGILYRLGLTGHDPRRYGGLAYGNVSARTATGGFIVSGTQTGAMKNLGPRHYCRVSAWDFGANLIVADGPIPPSSEALTHAAAYEADPDIRYVLHVHSPDIWNHAEYLGIPGTPAGIGFGTPEMALSVKSLLRTPPYRLISMRGHRDGLIAVGATAEAAALLVIRTLAMVMARPK